MNSDQLRRMKEEQGFIAALDQSGGSTPKALETYGIAGDRFTNEHEMFELVHQMRTRIIKSPSFVSEKILGAILFENTMDQTIDSMPTAQYLWEVKGIVPFLKIDKGLADEANGVQLMKDNPGLDALLERAKAFPIFGTKERSVIHEYNEQGIQAVVDQQFEIGKQVLSHGLVPILEPEVSINAQQKDKIEHRLLEVILEGLDKLPEDQAVMFKLTIPETADLYLPLINHPKVVRVVALSGGYSQAESCAKLSVNHGLIASFSRAFSTGLHESQSDSEFDAMMQESIDHIYFASIA
ncbi:MAG: fructose bisphosphate aldolase [Erysipelothrix sp.]|nr:fructose bisphosphate aldolase [Erysipelothrix sp.]